MSNRTDSAVLDEMYVKEKEQFDVPLTEDAPFTRETVNFGRGGERDLFGTLYRPRTLPENPMPSVVYIHGGGWRGGNTTQFVRQAAAMTGLGFAGLCIEYRLSGEAPYPAAIEDCKCAVRYLRSRASEWHLDPDRIGAVGGSAGGHLSAFLLTTGDRQDWDGEGGHENFSSAIQAAVLFNGEFDLPEWWRFGKCNDLMDEFLLKTYEEAPALYDAASPLTHVSDKTPPCLVIHGELDALVPISQSIDLHERMVSKGRHSELIRVADVGHAWFNKGVYFQTHLEQLMDFLDRQLGSKRTGPEST